MKAEEYAEQARWQNYIDQTSSKKTDDTGETGESDDPLEKDHLKSLKRGFYLKYKGLNHKISELLEDYSNVSLVPFDLTDK